MSEREASLLRLWGLVIVVSTLVNIWLGNSQDALIVCALVLVAYAILGGK